MWRHVLGVQVYTPVPALYGGLGHLQLREGIGRSSWDSDHVCLELAMCYWGQYLGD